MKYLRYYSRLFSMCFMDQLANRANFTTWAIINVFTIVTYTIFFSVIFSGVNNINGWSEKQVLTVFGTGLLVQGLGSMTFFCFMYTFGEDIVKGNFDFKMLKPMNIHFLAAMPYLDLEDITVVPLALIVLVYALQTVSLFGVVLYLGLIICALILLFSLITIVESLAFKAVRIDDAYHFIWSIIGSSKYPIKPILNIFPLLGGFLFPMIMIASVPAEVLFGRYEWNWIAASVISAIILFIFSRWVFQKALLDYSSASS